MKIDSLMPLPLRNMLRGVDYAIRQYLVMGRFIYQGEVYKYFCHKHASTWRSERALEIPIAWRMVQQNKAKRILEVGNVLSNYFPVRHDILDKYEIADGVINEDAETFRSDKLYDVIISVSTMEHIGWNEEPQDPEKILRCINHLIGLLAADGSFLFTVPVAYNPHLDHLLFDNRIAGAHLSAFKRVSMYSWEPVVLADLKGVKYGSPRQNANGVVVALIRK